MSRSGNYYARNGNSRRPTSAKQPVPGTAKANPPHPGPFDA